MSVTGMIYLPREAVFTSHFNPALLGGVVVLTATVLAADDGGWTGSLYPASPTLLQPITLTAVPYYAWDNRQPDGIRVWLSEPCIQP